MARDIQSDKDFPVGKSEEEMISYLNFKTSLGGTNPVFKRMIRAYDKQKSIKGQAFDLDARFAALKSENWNFYKEYFSVNKVILVGTKTDFYKAYCVDSSNKKALYFDIKSSANLNDISIVDESNIHIGNLTTQVTVPEAIRLLENCAYDTTLKPDTNRFKELLSLLKANTGD
jgi:hypothetical protein